MTRSKALIVAAALALVVPFATITLGTTSVLAAEDPDPIVEAERLASEGEVFFQDAGDTDAPNSERRKSRQEAYKRLKEARRILDDVLDANPDRTEELDGLYSRIAMMLFWVKKEAAIGELDGIGPPTSRGPADTSEPDKPKTGSGIGGSRRGPPKPPVDRPPPPVDEPGGDAPAAPPEPTGPTPADDLAEIASYEKKHPGDVPGLHERYTAFLEKHADPALLEYEQALGRREALDRKLKDVYRTLRDEDPAELADKGDAGVKRLAKQLVEDLAADRDETVRVRAARYLGSLGSSHAVAPLIETLETEQTGPVADAAAEALGAIGGRVTCRRLVRRRADEFFQDYVVEILGTIVARGGPEGRVAGETLAEYVLERDDTLQAGAIEQLRDAGKAGALGLSILVSVAPPGDRTALIEHLGGQGEPRAAGRLALFMKAGLAGIEKDHSRAARTAIEKLGKPCVRYLIPVLDEKDVAVWTAEMLRRLTDAKPKNDKRKTWERWFSKHRREFR